MKHQISFGWLLLLSVTFFTTVSSAPGRLSPVHPKIKPASVSEDFETFFYTQTLDHFNYKPESYRTFQQRYIINSKHWGGAEENAPIFAYFGEEGPLDEDLPIIGFLNDNAPRFKALIIFIEHRFYGKSVPFGTLDEVINDENTRGYFSSAQAIADYAEVLVYLKEKLSAQNSPVIVIGGSYGGMLASWFRLKYPHIAIGALASSAPILYFDNITPQDGYYSVVTNDFREASESCYETIRNSWSVIDELASRPNGISFLSQRFKTCSPLGTSSELKDYLDTMYAVAAQYNHPPTYPVTVVCGGIDGAPEGTDILGRIFAGVVAYGGERSCYEMKKSNSASQTNLGWSWQTCSELVIPIGRGSNDTMFPSAPFSLNDFANSCMSKYGVPPRPHWVTTYYGGHDIKLVLQRFASNIIFSNGLRDPYSSGGVLEKISDSVLPIYTVNGSHCLDILTSSQSDPQWLVMQRQVEIEIIRGWFAKYYADLHTLQI